MAFLIFSSIFFIFLSNCIDLMLGQNFWVRSKILPILLGSWRQEERKAQNAKQHPSRAPFGPPKRTLQASPANRASAAKTTTAYIAQYQREWLRLNAPTTKHPRRSRGMGGGAEEKYKSYNREL